MTTFVGRQDELTVIDELWGMPNASLLILYGRRRIGKTRLLTHWLKQHPGSGLYWVAEPTSQLSQLRAFSQALYNFSSPGLHAQSDFTYPTWEMAFNEVARIAERQKIAVFIDELGYLIDADSSFPGVLQNMWDHVLKNANVMLALSGSQMAVIQNMLDYSGPLYGRATGVIELPPLGFSATHLYFPEMSARDRVKLYAIWGGVPAYWELIDPNKSLRDNLRFSFLRSNMLMQQEPLLLLQDFITDPHNYIGIMHALASGLYTRTRIASSTGLPEGHMSKYLRVLRETGFVDRFVPMTEDAARSRRGHYRITDPLLRFYYRFLPKHNSRLALGEQEETLLAIEEELPSFIQENTWAELCREWTLTAGRLGRIPLSINEVGGAWYRHTNIPVVGIDHDKKHIVFGTTIWDEGAASLANISELISKSQTIMGNVSHQSSWKVLYLGFAGGKWDDDARTGVESLVSGLTALQPWQTVGIKLIDLEKMDENLLSWAEYEITS